jgi:predicted O-linked N-acetylglucosamine transferase (SPINDLY family)
MDSSSSQRPEELIPFNPTPDDIEAMVNPSAKALVAETEDLFRHGEWKEATENLKRIMRMNDPASGGYSLAQCHHALGDCAMNMRLNGHAITHYQESLRLEPKNHSVHENLIFLLDSQPWTTDKAAHRARQAWWTHIGAPAYAERKPFLNDFDPEKTPLRVGYIGQDFRFHSAMIAFASAVFEPSAQIQPVFYSTLPEAHFDHVTRDLMQKWGPHFVDVSRHTHKAVAEIIHQDRIDILVDLAGYTAGNRLWSFAYAPAPIRITAWGYATGVASPAITHLFADPIVATETTRQRLSEQVVDLPCVIGFYPRTDVPEPNPLPCLVDRPKFAVFQRASKLNSDTFATWTKILKQTPESILVFKGTDYNGDVREWIVREMASVRHQLSFELGSGHLEHQHWYGAMDLSLDPWPQTGGVSSMESLYMGVPMVTLTGERVIQRTSHSILQTLGLPEFICTTKQQYIKTAVEMVTTKREWLNTIRLGLRDRMKASPILNGYRDVVEGKYRELWREACAKEKEQAA